MNPKLCIPPELSVRDAISALVEGGERVVFVTSPERRLLGILTNGDMRKYLLTGKPLTVPVREAMNPSPVVFYRRETALDSRARREYIVYPIVSPDGTLEDALFQDAEAEAIIVSRELERVPLVIMAGGKGTRLYPYTKILPKAIIPIGQYSIVERIIQSFYKYGCREVYMILNHKAAIIKAFMGEIDTRCRLHFVEETQPSGTAGGLALLKDRLKSTFILSNCDILINDDLACAYKTHIAQGNQLTYVCAMRNFVVPYGVVDTEPDGKIQSIREKPQYSFLANTGVYVLEPSVIAEIQPGECIHMTDLTARCMQKGLRAGVFPISEKSWLDMGQINELEDMLQKLEPGN